MCRALENKSTPAITAIKVALTWSCFSYAGGKSIWTVIQEVFQMQLYKGNWEVQQPQFQNIQP